ncbi:hypothetical protein [Maribacter sp.]|uniref:hypothetical protein n=1 Tax=Maribacter sp. TaxID=1897614 RepID=UPI00329A02EA
MNFVLSADLANCSALNSGSSNGPPSVSAYQLICDSLKSFITEMYSSSKELNTNKLIAMPIVRNAKGFKNFLRVPL